MWALTGLAAFSLFGAVPSAHADAVDDYVLERMRKEHIPGLSLAVIRGGKIIKEKGYGFADVFGVDGKDDLATLSSKSPAYKTIVGTIAADVGELRAEMKAGGRSIYEVTDGNVGRFIDLRCLTT